MLKYLKSNKQKEVSAVESFRKEEDDLITFDSLSKIQINKVEQMYPENQGRVECTRISSTNKNLMFTVTMKGGEVWQKHHHDCHEKILVYKGRLRNLITDEKVVKTQMIEFEPFQTHYVMAEEDSIFYVEFIKPE